MPPHEPYKCSNDPVCIWQQLLGTDVPSSVTDNFVDIIGNITHKPYVTSSTFSVPVMRLSTEKPKDKILSEEDQRIIFMLNKQKTTSEVCGRPVIGQGRIVNGKQAAFAEFPWQIAMFARRPLSRGDPKLKCGAVLLNSNWAVTAAHCLEGIRTGDIFLRLGEYDLESEDEQFAYENRQVSEVITHPKFKAATFENDIALLRLQHSVIYQPNIIPICLPDGDDTYAGRTGIVTGWGRLSEGGPLPSVLQKVALPILTNSECEKMYLSAGSEQVIPEENFLCAGFKEGKQDACDGDSGGPMIFQEKDRSVLIGIVSWGIDCAAPNQPGAYTRITKYREWLDINMNKARRIRPKKIKKNQ